MRDSSNHHHIHFSSADAAPRVVIDRPSLSRVSTCRPPPRSTPWRDRSASTSASYRSTSRARSSPWSSCIFSRRAHRRAVAPTHRARPRKTRKSIHERRTREMRSRDTRPWTICGSSSTTRCTTSPTTSTNIRAASTPSRRTRRRRRAPRIVPAVSKPVAPPQTPRQPRSYRSPPGRALVHSDHVSVRRAHRRHRPVRLVLNLPV